MRFNVSATKVQKIRMVVITGIQDVFLLDQNPDPYNIMSQGASYSNPLPKKTFPGVF